MDDHRLQRPSRYAGQSPFVPLLLLALALVGWFAFQSYQLARERQQLGVLRAGQDAQMQAAAKVRASLDTVASATAALADGGNVNARILVEELRKRGITINPNAAAALPSAPKGRGGRVQPRDDTAMPATTSKKASAW
jgi:hypothetical protein